MRDEELANGVGAKGVMTHGCTESVRLLKVVI